LPSLGTVGYPYDNAGAEPFWARMQVELLDRKRWKTRIELANAIFEYIEGFHNRRRDIPRTAGKALMAMLALAMLALAATLKTILERPWAAG
jgi:Integrase core domain